MASWQCEQCGAYNHSAAKMCDGCGFELAPSRAAVKPSVPADPGPPPCTFEQNQQAAKIVNAVLTGKITAEEGQKRMDAVFAKAPA